MPSAGEDAERVEFSLTAGGNAKRGSHLENSLAISNNNEHTKQTKR